MTRETAKKYILEYLRAVMPVSVDSVLYWTKEQLTGDFDVAEILMELVREKKIEIELITSLTDNYPKIYAAVDFFHEDIY